MEIQSNGVVLDGPRIRDLRKRQALSQVALAERAPIALKTMRHAEQSKPIMLRSWRRIAEALGVEPAELLPGGGE